MQKKSSLFVGLFLILLGILSLGGNIGMSLSRQAPHSFYQLWPIIIIGMGLLFIMPPLFVPQNRGLGGLFIPGLPILVTGGILFAASVSNHWSIWGTMWPLEVIGVALGLALATIFIRVIWLVIPAFIIGFVGLALQFTAMTGLWASWAILWLRAAVARAGISDHRPQGTPEHIDHRRHWVLRIFRPGLCGSFGIPRCSEFRQPDRAHVRYPDGSHTHRDRVLETR